MINFHSMKTVELTIPENLDISSTELGMIVASKLYELGKLSLGQAAEMAGFSKRSFAEMLGRYNVSIFNHPPSDLSRDVTNA